ncbi:MAG: WecB/TagA/CpsF family glycosyltransferase [Clostridia bacterium]
MNDIVNILGANVHMVTMEQAQEQAMALMETDGCSVIYTPNSEIILYASNNPEFMEKLNSADLTIADGIGVVYAAKMLNKPLKERVAGYDLVCRMFKEMAEKKKSVYLLGSKPGVAEEAAKTIVKNNPGIVIAGTADGYFKEDGPVIEKINAAAPDFLMVCLGFPKQEEWIYKNRDKLNAKLVIGAGGCLDVFAGTVLRAPKFYCDHGLEWLYRLMKQPSRFIRMLALPKFALKVFFTGKRYK